VERSLSSRDDHPQLLVHGVVTRRSGRAEVAGGGASPDAACYEPGTMTVCFSLQGRLEYRDQTAIDAVKAALEEGGYVGHRDNLLDACNLKWSGTVLTIASSGSMPYSCLEICTAALEIYAEHAMAGEVVILNTDDRVGERILAGGESDELDEAEVDALVAGGE
jgi:hypothetical protein